MGSIWEEMDVKFKTIKYSSLVVSRQAVIIVICG